MKQWHYVLVAVATVAAIIPAFAPSLLPIALIGTLLGVAAVFLSLRGVDAEDRNLRSEIRCVEEEITKARKERDSAIAHADELDKMFKDNGYAELAENRERIEMESADFDRQIEAKRIEFEQEMERQCAEYERDLSERNAQQERILQEKTALEMKLQSEMRNLLPTEMAL